MEQNLILINQPFNITEEPITHTFLNWGGKKVDLGIPLSHKIIGNYLIVELFKFFFSAYNLNTGEEVRTHSTHENCIIELSDPADDRLIIIDYCNDKILRFDSRSDYIVVDSFNITYVRNLGSFADSIYLINVITNETIKIYFSNEHSSIISLDLYKLFSDCSLAADWLEYNKSKYTDEYLCYEKLSSMEEIAL